MLTVAGADILLEAVLLLLLLLLLLGMEALAVDGRCMLHFDEYDSRNTLRCKHAAF